MTEIQMKHTQRLREKLLENYSQEKLDRLEDWTEKIGRISKVRTKNCDTTDYIEISASDIREDGSIHLPNDKTFAPANAAALESQRLRVGDLVFSFRSKMNKIGLVDKEYALPVVGNHGLMRIIFKEEYREDGAPAYIRDYLTKPLIRSYLTEMMVVKSGVKTLDAEVLKDLPVPVLTHGGEDAGKYFALLHAIDEFNELAKYVENAGSDAFFLQHQENSKLSPLINAQRELIENLKSYKTKRDLLIGKNFSNVLNEDFTKLPI
jgi:hypothetical protein